MRSLVAWRQGRPVERLRIHVATRCLHFAKNGCGENAGFTRIRVYICGLDAPEGRNVYIFRCFEVLR